MGGSLSHVAYNVRFPALPAATAEIKAIRKANQSETQHIPQTLLYVSFRRPHRSRAAANSNRAFLNSLSNCKWHRRRNEALLTTYPTHLPLSHSRRALAPSVRSGVLQEVIRRQSVLGDGRGLLGILHRTLGPRIRLRHHFRLTDPPGFGLVTHDDQLVAEGVAFGFHELDGRQVDATIAVPRSECLPVERTSAWRTTKRLYC